MPSCLKEIGLNKKRYSDGQYWYGLKQKKSEKNVEIDKTTDEMEQEFEKRQKLYNKLPIEIITMTDELEQDNLTEQ